MKKLFFFLLLVLSLISCIPIHRIETSDYRLIPKSKSDINTFFQSYVDDKISISFNFGTTATGFSIRNCTNDTLKILLDKVVYFYEDKYHSVIHAKSRNSEVILPHSWFTDFIWPTDNIYHEMAWSVDSIKCAPGTGWSMQEKIEYFKPQPFSLIIPIQINHEVLMYKFDFQDFNHR